MNNNTEAVFFKIPVGEAVFEKQWLNLLLKAMQHLNPSNEHYNIIVLIVMLCLLLIVPLHSLIKYRHRFACQRKDEGQHKSTEL
jgi:hypothetical protein